MWKKMSEERGAYHISFNGDTGGSWWINERGDGWFTINISASLGREITFDYWIVQVQDDSQTASPPEDGATTPSSPEETANETPADINTSQDQGAATPEVTTENSTQPPADETITEKTPADTTGAVVAGENQEPTPPPPNETAENIISN
ncbi:MAG: hypothetical protein V1661_02585 [bacterium]